VLATVLLSDIVASTQRASRLGDRRWRQLLNVHDELARRVVEEFGGRLVKTTGDGLLATFDGPGRGIRCAAALRDELGGIGVQLRVGLHTGEVELRDGDVGGIAVHIAARVMAAAGPGEIFASRTVGDLTVGSDIVLDDRGTHRLRGVEGTWRLFAVVGALAVPPATGHVPVGWAGEPGVPTFRSRSGASGTARPDADGRGS
jgi:class 3 adenylate cyclase